MTAQGKITKADQRVSESQRTSRPLVTRSVY